MALQLSTFEIAEITVPLLLLILEAGRTSRKSKPFGIISKIRGVLDSYWVLKQGFSIYNLLSFFFILGFWIFFLAPLPQLLAKGNIFTEFYWSGHWTSWIGLISVITFFGYFDIIKGIYAGALVYSVHELVWITSAGIYNNILLTLYEHFAPLMIVMALLIAGYFIAYRGIPKYKEVLIITTIIVFDILWMVAGFHVAIENWLPVPETIYYTSPIVNVIEVLSWLLPCLVALL